VIFTVDFFRGKREMWGGKRRGILMVSSFNISVEQNILNLQSAPEKYFRKTFLENQCMHTLVNSSLSFMVPFFYFVPAI